TSRPTPPTSSLPPLTRLHSCTLAQLSQAIENLRLIYNTPAAPIKTTITLPKPKTSPKHLIHDASVPDSGYASAEGEEDEETPEDCAVSSSFDIDALRSDAFEREHTIRWLTGFTARSGVWLSAAEDEKEADARANVVDAAASLLAAFAGEEEEEDITRTFTFPTRSGYDVHVELNDAALLSDDHTSVGLQSWGSSIRLAERMCLDPATFGLVSFPKAHLRILELGAGTGLLSIATAQLLASLSSSCRSTIVATDYHPSVLANLRANVDANCPPSTEPLVDVLPLDWQHPVYEGPFAEPFDVVLAADVVYHPEHARWIKACMERLLGVGGVFWLIIPIRPTGRHEGLSNTVEATFPKASTIEVGGPRLAIVSVEELTKHDGIGRADEGGYKLYKIKWVH
ncbi:S-adenosyl-L-methionine-dependent methyltransferase, partial [Trametes punicea]